MVTGAAGYIGSHLVNQPGDWVAVDNLASGRRTAIPAHVPFHAVDVTNAEALASVFNVHDIEGVVHLAALKRVADSVKNPAEYERVNVGGLQATLAAMRHTGVATLVFASSAAVYGPLDAAAGASIAEDAPLHPANPYGHTKLAGEQLVADFAAASGAACVTLRAFNAGGTSLGPPHAGGLVELVAEAALTRRPLPVYGTEYPTADGTCVRDYVHIDDVVSAIRAATVWTGAHREATVTLNVGTGKGTSVQDVIRAVEEASGRTIVVDSQANRPGDVPVAVADVTRAVSELDWQPRHTLADIAHSTWLATSSEV